MDTINIHEAKTHLSRLVEKAAAGEPFIIAKAGRPMVQVIALAGTGESPLRKPGFLKGQVRTPVDFKAFARDEIEEMFFGNPDKLTMGKKKAKGKR
jgi:prevent-host-death family protein